MASFTEALTAPAAEVKLLSKGGEAVGSGGTLSLSLPPGGIGFFTFGDTPTAGLVRKGLYWHRLENGAIWKGQTAVLYKEYGGVPEILRFVENGETVQIGAGRYTLKAFDWTSPIQPQTSSITFATE